MEKQNNNSQNSQDCVTNNTNIQGSNPREYIDINNMTKEERIEHERRIKTEKELSHDKDVMSQLVDRIATDSFQG